ncbi:hypothetical protein C7S16_1576 [Burkholderia thailandensis]|uniref:Uncharacterized protein n=1 Tax=Burkholderia thailandensis TaxID=57975 RepID=A0AAW9CTG4_BURTH|nr:hypothetical protein [Burkholderia thailandensis]MDW9254168.1 hypothetical protein [Burkholderia thailandensis]
MGKHSAVCDFVPRRGRSARRAWGHSDERTARMRIATIGAARCTRASLARRQTDAIVPRGDAAPRASVRDVGDAAALPAPPCAANRGEPRWRK